VAAEARFYYELLAVVGFMEFEEKDALFLSVGRHKKSLDGTDVPMKDHRCL
jgi:hypothetical protein